MITITVVINKNSVSPDIQLGSFFLRKLLHSAYEENSKSEQKH